MTRRALIRATALYDGAATSDTSTLIPNAVRVIANAPRPPMEDSQRKAMFARMGRGGGGGHSRPVDPLARRMDRMRTEAQDRRSGVIRPRTAGDRAKSAGNKALEALSLLDPMSSVSSSDPLWKKIVAGGATLATGLASGKLLAKGVQRWNQIHPSKARYEEGMRRSQQIAEANLQEYLRSTAAQQPNRWPPRPTGSPQQLRAREAARLRPNDPATRYGIMHPGTIAEAMASQRAGAAHYAGQRNLVRSATSRYRPTETLPLYGNQAMNHSLTLIKNAIRVATDDVFANRPMTDQQRKAMFAGISTSSGPRFNIDQARKNAKALKKQNEPTPRKPANTGDQLWPGGTPPWVFDPSIGGPNPNFPHPDNPNLPPRGNTHDMPFKHTPREPFRQGRAGGGSRPMPPPVNRPPLIEFPGGPSRRHDLSIMPVPPNFKRLVR